MHRIKIGGKFKVSELKEEAKKKIMDIFASKGISNETKEEKFARIFKGKVVEGKDLAEVHAKLFPPKPKREKAKKVKKPIKKPIEKKEPLYTKKELESLSFEKLRKIGYKVGTKGRGKKELVREILALTRGK